MHYIYIFKFFGGGFFQGNIMISPSNPTTNTIQGPNVVMYNGALYYNCYNQDSVCRFNLSTKAVTTVKLPAGTRWVLTLFARKQADSSAIMSSELHAVSYFLQVQLKE